MPPTSIRPLAAKGMNKGVAGRSQLELETEAGGSRHRGGPFPGELFGRTPETPPGKITKQIEVHSIGVAKLMVRFGL
jgi:hypothetical protein